MANQNNNENDENKNVEDNGNGNQNENGSQGANNNDGGNQNQGASGGSNDNSGSGNGGNQQGGKTFTQEDVSRMMAKEKQQGRNSVFNELGISPDDADIISIIKAVVAAKGANEDDSQSNDNQSNDNNGAAIAQAEERARIAEMKADAMKAGVKAQYVDDAVDLVRARYSDDNNDFNAILNELKSKYTIWFEDTEEDDKGGAGKRGTGSTISAKNQQGGKNNQDEGLGKRLAGLRRPQTKKSSYFSS